MHVGRILPCPAAMPIQCIYSSDKHTHTLAGLSFCLCIKGFCGWERERLCIPSVCVAWRAWGNISKSIL